MTAKPPALPVTKADKIRYLLDHWADLFDPDVTSPQGSPGGDGVGLMPAMSHHPSVVELERCLGCLRLVAPVQFSHLMAAHTAEWRIAQVPKLNAHGRVSRRRDDFGHWVVDTEPGREQLVPAWVDRGKVMRAERHLCDWFRGPVGIPDELWDALTVSSAEAEVRAKRRRGRRLVA